ncbi:hypothetical protein E5672_18205 [Alteromonas portus]|uniref:Uncharacterized protein n=1 Tax=Alteromonas portus TaxID=2565549 RepID=A0A4U0ZAT0_9ALTE|nr:hypothetical protein [Alteromonas portus]TKB01158.1 hypothetical protein E5672_18205 [Alteromonas portus]
MALENTTTNTVNTGFNALVSKLGLHSGFNENETTNSTVTSATTAGEAATSGQSLPSLFSSLLTLQSPTNETTSATNVTGGNNEVIDATGLAGDALSTLATVNNIGDALSDDAIVAMQGTLLTALQNNVFQALASNSDTVENTTNTVVTDSDTLNADQDAPSPTLFDSLYTNAFGEDGLNLKDGFDVLNIANHLPVVSDIYEATTSNHTAAAASLAGSFLYGGIGGLMFNAIDLAVENVTGQSISNNVWSMGQSLLSTSLSDISADATGTSQTAADNALASMSIETDDVATKIADKAANATYQFVQRGLY